MYFSKACYWSTADRADHSRSGQSPGRGRGRAGLSGRRQWRARGEALAAQLKGHGVTVLVRCWPAGAQGTGFTAALRRAALRKDARGRALVLWLRPADIAALGDVPAARPRCTCQD